MAVVSGFEMGNFLGPEPRLMTLCMVISSPGAVQLPVP